MNVAGIISNKKYRNFVDMLSEEIGYLKFRRYYEESNNTYRYI